MSDLLKYLESNAITGYRRDEVNEQILTVYNLFKWAVRSKCDTIKVKQKQVSWSVNDKTIDTFSIDDLHTSIDFCELFEDVIKRDQTIREHVVQVLSRDAVIVYRLQI
jgi:hypothetical protein